jgi:hypothetical protein
MLPPEPFFAPFWQVLKPFVLLAILLLAGAYMLYMLKRRWLAAAGMPEIDRMTGEEFEARMALLFRGRGYGVDQNRGPRFGEPPP